MFDILLCQLNTDNSISIASHSFIYELRIPRMVLSHSILISTKKCYTKSICMTSSCVCSDSDHSIKIDCLIHLDVCRIRCENWWLNVKRGKKERFESDFYRNQRNANRIQIFILLSIWMCFFYHGWNQSRRLPVYHSRYAACRRRKKNQNQRKTNW